MFLKSSSTHDAKSYDNLQLGRRCTNTVDQFNLATIILSIFDPPGYLAMIKFSILCFTTVLECFFHMLIRM